MVFWENGRGAYRAGWGCSDWQFDITLVCLRVGFGARSTIAAGPQLPTELQALLAASERPPGDLNLALAGRLGHRGGGPVAEIRLAGSAGSPVTCSG